MSSRSISQSTARRLSRSLQKSDEAEAIARLPGFLQGLDPRAKIVGLLSLTTAAAWTKSFSVFALLLGVGLLLATVSQIPLRTLALRLWLGAFLFTGSIAFPALFLVPGRVIYTVPLLHWGVTEQGLRSAAFLLARVEVASTFTVLLVLSTPWMHVLKGLRVLHVPVVLIVILSMTYRYAVLLLQTALEMFEARESRAVGKLGSRDGRRLAAATAGVLLAKTLSLSEEIYFAMRSRGYQGEVYLLEDFHMRPKDWVAASTPLGAAAILLLVG